MGSFGWGFGFKCQRLYDKVGEGGGAGQGRAGYARRRVNRGQVGKFLCQGGAVAGVGGEVDEGADVIVLFPFRVRGGGWGSFGERERESEREWERGGMEREREGMHAGREGEEGKASWR